MPGTTRNGIIGKVHRLKLSGRVRVANPEGHKRTYSPRPRKPKPAALVPEVPNPDAALPPDQSSFAVTFEELRNPHCRWPIGEQRPFKYCGAPHVEGGSFCRRHHAIAYQPAVRVSPEERQRRSH